MPALLRTKASVGAVSAGPPAGAQRVTFADLDGWRDDDHRAALSVFRTTCATLTGPEWQPLCRLAADAGQTDTTARDFFETFFRPLIIGTPPALFTGYFEPELQGSPYPTARFACPIYAPPPDLADGSIWYSRQEIEQRGLMRGRGLEIAWLEDEVEVYFLQVQGSGRIIMPDGQVLRVGFAGKNGQPYRSIGQELVRRGSLNENQVSAPRIRAYLRANPAVCAPLLQHNPSFVFFRALANLPADRGPIGAMGRPIVALRSVAVDPEYTPLGAPVWIEKDGPQPIRRLMVAQDTGGAIRGPQRADIFYGTGPDAGEAAGGVKCGGRMVVLLPINQACALLPEG